MTEYSKIVRKTISLPADLLEKGLARTRRQTRTFSSYIAHLVAMDVRGELPTEPARAPQANEPVAN